MNAPESDYLACCRVLAAAFRTGSLRRATPCAEAALFLHNVTGLSDIEPSFDAYGRVTGMRARGDRVGMRVHIGLRIGS
jgi:hypothetical protein